ncbi:centrosomal protein of 63 kDa-like isoform X1 [Entelurus aequoreus]|uniref:centrosomal protein of 63 kDa-like isoform X1 n=1 Tax=Entelurus aequoreus TaxID=161455 RepID=UPI002B1DA40C|nr:centrosomal protein of 63 kDa-like isoform X1 [Entelurus aequoreus]
MEARNLDLSFSLLAQNSSVLSDCEPELQELMRQIDIMISHQKSEWEARMEDMRLQLHSGREEMAASRVLLQRKDLEINVLRKQLEDAPNGRQALATKYEKQLQTVSEECDKLKSSYHKLQRRHYKKFGAEESDQAEVRLLKEKLEEYSGSCVKWEQQRVEYHKQLALSEVQKESLTEQLTHLKAEAASLASLEKSYLSSLRHLEEENLQLRRQLAETRRQLQLAEGGTAHAAAGQSRPARERCDANGEAATSYEGEIQRLFTELKTSERSRSRRCSGPDGDRRTAGGKAAASPIEHVPEGRSSSSEDALSSREGSTPSPMEPLPAFSADDVVCHFLEHESALSKELMLTLDSHILNMTENHARTASQRLMAASAPGPS